MNNRVPYKIEELRLERDQLNEKCKELANSLTASQNKLERLQKHLAEYEEQAKSTSSSNCDLVIVKVSVRSFKQVIDHSS